MEAQRVQANLKGTEVQVAVGPLVAPAGRGLGEDGRGGVPPGFDQDRFGQFKVKMCRCLRRLVGDVRCVAFRSSALVPGGRRRWVRDRWDGPPHPPRRYLLVSVLLALAPPPALREPLEEEEPSESEEELLMLSLSWPRPQEVAAQLPRSGLRLSVGELSDVVSGALLSMLAMPGPKQPRQRRPQVVMVIVSLYQWRQAPLQQGSATITRGGATGQPLPQWASSSPLS